MSFKDCIDSAEGGEELNPEKARRYRTLFDELEGHYKRTMGDEQARAAASAAALDRLKADALERRRRLLLQAKAWRNIQSQMKRYRDAKGDIAPGAAVRAHVGTDELADFSSIEARRKQVRGWAHRQLDGFLSKMRLTVLGNVRDRGLMIDIVREAFGTKTGNKLAEEFADAWGKTSEMLRLRFNAAGGHIGRREDWGLPQHHDTMLVRKAGYEEWRNFVWGRLDRAKMQDPLTGQPFSDGRLELALREVYETISRDGWNKVTPSAGRGRSIANRFADHRFLAFKGGDAWLEYNGRFGTGEPFSVMMGHVDIMAREIARMEVLGPNDRATLEAMRQLAMKEASFLDAKEGGNRFMGRAQRDLAEAGEMYETFVGHGNLPASGPIARTFAGLRNYLTSVQLGAAFIPSIAGDTATMRLTAAFTGLPQAKTVARAMKLFAASSLEDKRLAVRSGLIAENWSAHAIAHERYLGEITGPEITRRFADATLRLSGLSPWTQASRWAFGMEFMATLAENAGRSLDELDPALQRTLQRYGLAGAWDDIRRITPYEHKGAIFLRPEEIEQNTDLQPSRRVRLATRYLEMIQTETDYAIPSGSLRSRTALVGPNKPGTLIGEIVRSVAMYKQFPATMLFTHVRRGWIEARQGRGGYLASLIISTTLAGALAIQMKEVSKGRDPREMENDPRFWLAAIIQGGGLGLIGDLLFADQTRYGQGLEEVLAGPVVSFFSDTARLTVGSAQKAMAGDDPQLARNIVQYVRRHSPGGSLWYARLALDRLLFDQIQLWIDPKAQRRFRDMERRQQREYGNRYWWRPGVSAPDRPPAVAAR